MKRILLLICCVVLTGASFAQTNTQHGRVKTKGRMVNGKHVKGQGLSNATITIKGRGSVVSNGKDGTFAFTVPTPQFIIANVSKKGYELVDSDIYGTVYTYPVTPFFIVMETPEQQLQDQLDAAEKINATLKEQLKESLAENKRLLEQNEITQEQYEQRLREITESQKNQQQLISEMADLYAKMDYDQLDELNQRISDYILNGRLKEADSLINTKGSIENRVLRLQKHQQVNAEERKELDKRQEILSQSEVYTRKELEDLAQDCYNKFQVSKLENHFDSAAYYIALRADLDTLNMAYQREAEKYIMMLTMPVLLFQSQLSKPLKLTSYEPSFQALLRIYRRLAPSDPESYASLISSTLRILYAYYKSIGDYQSSSSYLKEAKEIEEQYHFNTTHNNGSVFESILKKRHQKSKQK